MLYADNQFKWVAVLNRKAPLPTLLNALGHLAVGMQALPLSEEAKQFHNYGGADGNPFAAISHWPVIVLQGNNSNQLRTLRSAAAASGLACQTFVDTMLGSSAADQIEKTKTTDDEKIEYIAVMLFGPAEALQALTRKFSLFSPPAADTYGRGFHTLDPH